MLQNIRELYGHKLAALDGDIGHVKDFYFDDTTWADVMRNPSSVGQEEAASCTRLADKTIRALRVFTK
jgi:hypothetical protein